jgi:hypothetical protein
MLDQHGGWRLAELRKRREIMWDQVGNPDDAIVARVSPVAADDVSTQDVLARYIAALRGTLKLIADWATNNSRSRDRRLCVAPRSPCDYPTT